MKTKEDNEIDKLKTLSHEELLDALRDKYRTQLERIRNKQNKAVAH